MQLATHIQRRAGELRTFLSGAVAGRCGARPYLSTYYVSVYSQCQPDGRQPRSRATRQRAAHLPPARANSLVAAPCLTLPKLLRARSLTHAERVGTGGRGGGGGRHRRPPGDRRGEAD